MMQRDARVCQRQLSYLIVVQGAGGSGRLRYTITNGTTSIISSYERHAEISVSVPTIPQYRNLRSREPPL